MNLNSLFTSLFSIVLIFSFQSVYSQNTSSLSGTITDQSTQSLVDFASVALFNEQNTQVAGMLSNDKGQFHFQNLKAGKYILRISFVGYDSYEKSLQLAASQKMALGKVEIKPSSSKVLNEVVVEAQAPSMQLGIDKKIFNVAQSLVSEGGSATDLLANVPSLSVDMDGAISLRGSSSVRILIDGKPSAMAGSDITQTLQALPANSVQSIEVITNPSAKYDAEGQSGIINIILKKNIRRGLNGMVNASAGSYNNYNGGLSLNYRDEHFNYYGNYNYRKSNRVGDGFNKNLNLLDNTITENNSESSRKGDSHSGKLGIDYNINEKTTVGVSGNFSIRDNNRSEDLFYRYLNNPNLTGTSTRTSKQNEDDTGYDLNLDFRRDFNRAGENIMANFAYGRSKEDGIEEYEQIFTDPNQLLDRQVNDGLEDGKNTNIQIDYILPFSENQRLEAGYRTSIRNDQEEQLSDRFNPQTNEFERDYGLSSNFKLDDIVHSVYSNYQNRITETLGFQVGLRLEQAYLNTRYVSFDPTIPIDERTKDGKLDYLRLYPSLFLTQQLNGEQQLQASYTRRVRRPRGWQVNPFVNISDPMNIRMGNPSLLPEDIHSLELSYAKFWPNATLTSSIYHRRVNDGVENIKSSVSDWPNLPEWINPSATVSQWYNISRNEATGFELISKITISPAVNTTANLNAYYNKYHGSEEFNIKGTDGYNWDANLNTEFKLSKVLTAQVRAQYDAPRTRAQGKTTSNFVVDAGTKLDVLNKKGSVMLNVRDLFNQRKWGGTTLTEQFSQQFEHRWMKRMFTLSFSYNFGQQDIKRRDNKKTNPNEEFGGDEGAQY